MYLAGLEYLTKQYFEIRGIHLAIFLYIIIFLLKKSIMICMMLYGYQMYFYIF